MIHISVEDPSLWRLWWSMQCKFKSWNETRGRWLCETIKTEKRGLRHEAVTKKKSDLCDSGRVTKYVKDQSDLGRCKQTCVRQNWKSNVPPKQQVSRWQVCVYWLNYLDEFWLCIPDEPNCIDYRECDFETFAEHGVDGSSMSFKRPRHKAEVQVNTDFTCERLVWSILRKLEGLKLNIWKENQNRRLSFIWFYLVRTKLGKL